MRKGGLLDGFPLHLLSGDADLPTVIVDHPDLGGVTVAPASDCPNPIIIISPTRDNLQIASSLLAASSAGRPHIIQADPRWVPLRDEAAGMIVVQLPAKLDPRGNSPDGHQVMCELSSELNRVLHQTGSILEVSPLWEPTPPESRWSSDSGTQRILYARPATGDQYFVTNELNPSPWPFRNVHHGRLRSLRIKGDLLIGRMGVRKLYNGARIVLRSKGRVPASGPLDRCVDVVQSQGASGEDTGIPVAYGGMGLMVNPGKNALVIGGRESSRIAKLPLSPYGISKMQDHLGTLEILHRQRNPTVTASLPKVVAQGTVHGQPYWAETVIEGVSGTTMHWNPAWRNKTAEAATEYITELHQSDRQTTTVNREIFDRLVGPRIATLEGLVQSRNWALNLGSFEEALWKTFRRRRISLVRTHGDYWPANLLFSQTSELTGVLDWDRSVNAGWPAIDLIHFIEFQRKWRAIWRLGSAVTGRLMPQRLSQRERKIYSNYFDAMDLPKDLWKGFVALYWLHRVSSRLSDEKITQRWCNWNILEPYPRILELLVAG